MTETSRAAAPPTDPAVPKVAIQHPWWLMFRPGGPTGSASPARGSSLPAFARIRSNSAGSARCARARKYASVRRAAAFSATATLMN
jgi:hypothetical protein